MNTDRGTKLLIVDGLAENLLALEASIRDDGYDVYQASSAEAALALLLEHDFALAILEVQMPGMSGLELAELMRGMTRAQHLPFVFISAAGGDSGYAFKGSENGAVDVLFRPLDACAVKSKVKVFVDLHRQRGELKDQLQALEEARCLQRMLVADLQSTQVGLQQALRMRDEFVSMVVHELRTPLSVLTMETRVRQHHLATDNVAYFAGDSLAKMLERDQRQLSCLTRLVDDMTDVTLMRQGKLSLRRRPCDLAALLRRVVDEVAGLHGEAPITIDAEGDPVLGDWDEFRLEQVIVNLLTNAQRYGEGKPISVRLERGPTTVAMRVRDQGMGIAPEDQPRVFEQFVRVGDRRRANGLGLGLFITKGLVEAHGGTIGVESAPGEGATFTVTLPTGSRNES